MVFYYLYFYSPKPLFTIFHPGYIQFKKCKMSSLLSQIFKLLHMFFCPPLLCFSPTWVKLFYKLSYKWGFIIQIIHVKEPVTRQILKFYRTCMRSVKPHHNQPYACLHACYGQICIQIVCDLGLGAWLLKPWSQNTFRHWAEGLPPLFSQNNAATTQ